MPGGRGLKRPRAKLGCSALEEEEEQEEEEEEEEEEEKEEEEEEDEEEEEEQEELGYQILYSLNRTWKYTSFSYRLLLRLTYS